MKIDIMTAKWIYVNICDIFITNAKIRLLYYTYFIVNQIFIPYLITLTIYTSVFF